MRKALLGSIAIGSVLMLASCLGGQDTPQATTQMGGPAFNNAGDNGPLVLLTVVVVVVLVAAVAMGMAMFRHWQKERSELRAELRSYRRPEFPASEGVPQLNGRAYHYQPGEREYYRQIGR